MPFHKIIAGKDIVQEHGKRRRACLLFRNFDSFGGQANVAISMARSLERSGFETTLLCGKKVVNDSFAQNFGTSIPVRRQVIFRPWPYKLKTYFEFGLPAISKFFSGIVINSYTSDILPFADITYVHYPRTLLIEEKTKNLFWKFYYKPYKVIEHSSCFRRAEKLVLANSHFTADAVKKEFKIDPLVLYPPVDMRPFEKETQKTKKDLVLTISRFSSEKGLEKIPAVAKSVNAKFVVLGSLYSEELYRRVLSLIRKNNVSDKVTLIPDAPVAVKVEFLKQAKVYFHTAPLEHFGISIIEGMGAGCIPIVSDSGGPREFVPDMWRYKDEEDAVSKIKTALDSWSPSIGREMKATASRFETENFEDAFCRILDIYATEGKVVPRSWKSVGNA